MILSCCVRDWCDREILFFADTVSSDDTKRAKRRVQQLGRAQVSLCPESGTTARRRDDWGLAQGEKW